MRARWLLGLFLAASGCFDDGASTPTPCHPACRDGYTCVYGTCLSLCNPPCGAGSRCVQLDVDRGTCVSDATDAAAASDAKTPATDAVLATDVATDDASPTDAATPPDVTAADVTFADLPGDDVSITDVPTDRPPMDAEFVDVPEATDASDVTDAPAPDVTRDVPPTDTGARCGHAGERCCAGISCFPGAFCVGERCAAYAAAPSECLSNQECLLGRVCAGGRSCGTNPDWRWCYQCLNNPGVARFGDPCRTYADCATGVCNLGRCTYACDPGVAGDMQCADLGVRNGRCAEIIYGLPPVSDAGAPRAWQVQGACELGCTRNGDCATGTVCVPISGDLNDRIAFICSTTRATAVAGTPCMWGDDCQSGMCIAGANPRGGAACSAPCTVDGDCPGTAPVCSPIRLFTSNGTPVQTRGCLPRR